MEAQTIDPVSQTKREIAERILNTALKISAIFVPLVAVLLILQILSDRPLGWITIVLSIYCMFFPLLWISRNKFSFRTLGVTYLGLMLLLSFFVQLRGGLTASPTSVQIIVLILSGMIFGPRGLFICLSVSLLSFTLAGFAVINEIVPPLSTTMWDPQIAGTWVRSGIIMAVFGGAAAMSVVYALGRLERETTRLKASLLREQTQRIALEHAELEKEAARKALAEAQRVEALGRLASGVAHDFNNSLTVITGAADLAEMNPDLPEKTRKALATIRKAAFKSADLTRSLMVLGRKDPTQLEVIRTDYLIYKIKDALGRLLPEDIEFELKKLESLPILIDRNQMERALINLVLNAKDAIENGGKISISCDQEEIGGNHPQLESGLFAKISVQDDGHGISEEIKDQVFEPFYTTKEASKGTGMGLSLVQSFVADAKGDVQIESASGEGTIVSLYIPTTAEQQTTVSARPLPDTETSVDENFKVLIVEDNPEVLATTSDTLRTAGIEVLEASDGDAALTVIDKEADAIDLLCIDGVIPGASSSTVIARMQEDHPASRIVVCSGYVEEELVLRGIEKGEFAYVRKPFLKTELLGCIRQELGLQQAN